MAVQPPRYVSVRQELADFARYGEAYQNYDITLAPHLPCTDLRRVLVDFEGSTALPLILYLELDAGLTEGQVSECYTALESFIARRVFAREETREYNKLFVEVIGSLRGLTGDQVKPALCRKLLSGSGTTRRWPTDEEIIEKAISCSAYKGLTTAALRLILERLEVALRTKKSETLDVPPGLQIEHVLPESWGEHWSLNGKSIPPNVVCFPHLAGGDFAELAELIRARNAQLQTLGNLTLLNLYLNPAASNGPFGTKLIEYKHSLLRLNRYFDGRTSWDEEAIRDRSRVLGEVFCEIWPRPRSVDQTRFVLREDGIGRIATI